MSEFPQILAGNARENPVFAILLGFLLYVVGVLVALQLIFLLSTVLWGIDFASIQTILRGNWNEVENGKMLFRFIQGGNQVVTWGMAGTVMGFLLGNPKNSLGWMATNRWSFYLIAALLMAVSFPWVQILHLSPDFFDFNFFPVEWKNDFISHERQNEQLIFEILSEPGWVAFGINVFVFVILPAVCEEIFFRGFLQQQLSRIMKPVWAITLTAIIFSLVHFQFTGFFARIFLAILLGYTFYHSQSLFPVILAHGVFNFISMMMSRFIFNQGFDSFPDFVPLAIEWVIGSLICIVGLLILLFKLSSRRQLSPTS